MFKQFWRKYVLRYDRALLHLGAPPQDYVAQRLYEMQQDELVLTETLRIIKKERLWRNYRFFLNAVKERLGV